MRQSRNAILLVCTVLVALFVESTHRPASQELGDTWSIVAVNPATGAVGVAGASCVPVAIDAIAALVPGHGAAAVQAQFSIANRNRVFQLLQEQRSADEIIDTMTGDASPDSRVPVRQYGVVTFGDDGVRTAGFTGSDNIFWAGDRQDDANAVSVQGNILEGEAVVMDALAAYTADVEPATMPDRLMRALEAGSAAGGDRRCNEDGVQQTATAAFIMVAQGDQPAFAAPDLGVSARDAPDAPWLYLSVTEETGGPNPVLTLREQYDAWRAEQRPAATATATHTHTPAAMPTASPLVTVSPLPASTPVPVVSGASQLQRVLLVAGGVVVLLLVPLLLLNRHVR